MDKTIVNFTPTGLIPRKSDSPYVPVTPSEIITDVKKAYELGITMVHLHAREPETGIPTHKKEIYGEIITGIREFAPDLIICVSTSGRINNDYRSRSEVLSLEGDVKPDMASLTLSSLNFNKKASINEPDTIIALAQEMADKGIKPELEIFDLGMANYANYLLDKGILKPPLYANVILGNIACAQPDLLHIGCLIRDLPDGTIISLGGVGRAQLAVNSLAVSIGYGVRIGLEDNLWYDKNRTKLASNMGLLERIHNIAVANGREFMAPAELRDLLNLSKSLI
jgi:uncharacterized protein (DUF849 family)